MKTSKQVFEQRLVTHGGITYSFSVANERAEKNVLFVHGVSGVKEDMEPMASAVVKQGWGAYLLDLPNHGKSSHVPILAFDRLGAWLNDAITAMKVTPDVIIGHSYGSAICYNFAALGLLPARTRLILACPTPNLSFLTVLLGQILIHLPRPLIAPAYNSWPVIATRVNYLSRRHDDSRRQLQLSERRKIGTLDVLTATQMGNLVRTHNPYDRILPAAVQRRTTVLIGDRDNVVTSRAVAQLRSLLPGATFDIVRGVGHILHFEAPDRVAKHLEVVR